mgnify:CR=1 FL=1
MERKNAWSQYSAEELSRLEAVNEDYKACLDAGKTERECVRLTIERIEKEGYKNLKEVIRNGEKVQAGDKVYAVCMDLSLIHISEPTRP